MTGFFEIRGYYDDWRHTHGVALAAARRAASAPGQAVIQLRLGEMHANLDEYDRALENFDQARQLLRGLGDRITEAHVLRSAGIVQRMLGNADEARQSLEMALATFVEYDDRTGIAHVQHGLGSIHKERGCLDEAAACYQHALELFEEAGDRFTQSLVLCSLGVVWRLTGQLARANDCLVQSLELSRSIKNQPGEAFALCYLGELKVEQGQLELARTLLDAARAVCEGIGERFCLALTWRALGTLHRTAGCPGAALDAFTNALEILTDLDLPIWRDRTLEAMGDLAAGVEPQAELVATPAS
jgi:tetratricopeptide (TPR) repeat protein